jgi:LmbE family N-acetylglucosaminyl deacetylase
MILPLTLGQAGTRTPLKILCLGAHSDDLEIGCGGTILRLLDEHPGSSVHWVVFSASPEREREARASAQAFTAAAASSTVLTKTFRESFFPAQWVEIKEFFEEVRRAFEPDLVLCHHRDDLHQDHKTIAELTWNTFRNHLVLAYEIPKYEGDLGKPNVYVPLSRELADRKVSLILEHFVSQAGRTWFRPDTFHGLMSVRAIECNAPSARAEAFHGRKIVI